MVRMLKILTFKHFSITLSAWPESTNFFWKWQTNHSPFLTDWIKACKVKKVSKILEYKLLLVCKMWSSHYSMHFQKKKKPNQTNTPNKLLYKSFLAYKPKISVHMSCLVINHAEETTTGLSVSYNIAFWVEEASLTCIWDTKEALPAQS